MSKRAEQRSQAREAHRLETEDARLFNVLAKLPPALPPEPGMEVNVYICGTCYRPTVTGHVNAGVTPAMLSCHANVDIRDDDGMYLEDVYEIPEGYAEALDATSDGELVDAALADDIDGALFVALAHVDPVRSEIVQGAVVDLATPEQAQRFGTAVLEAAAADLTVRCPGTAHSTFYNLPEPDDTPWPMVELLAEPPWEWYRPTSIEQLRPLENDLLHHLQQGGLLLRKRPGATGIAPHPDDFTEDSSKGPWWQRVLKSLAGPQPT